MTISMRTNKVQFREGGNGQFQMSDNKRLSVKTALWTVVKTVLLTLLTQCHGYAYELGSKGLKLTHKVHSEFKKIIVADINGQPISMEEALHSSKAVVVIARDNHCPISQKYGPIIKDIERVYKGKNILFLFLNVNPAQYNQKALEDHRRFKFQGPLVNDNSHFISSMLGIKTTTEVFVFSGGRLVYKGAIDNQYGIGYSQKSASNPYLKDILDKILKGQSFSPYSTVAPGCVVKAPTKNTSEKPLIPFSAVRKIISDKCLSCHDQTRHIGVRLDQYKYIKDKMDMIEYLVANDIMPPWYADPTVGQWENDTRLSKNEKATLLQWIKQGALGPKTPLKKQKSRNKIWSTIKPDIVFEIPKTISIPASGSVPYYYLKGQLDIKQDIWIRGWEVFPTNFEYLHHMIILAEHKENGVTKRQFVAGYTPGTHSEIYPPNVGRKIKKGSTLRYEIHYRTTGIPGKDRTKIGLLLHKKSPSRQIEGFILQKKGFSIPAHSEKYKIENQKVIEKDILLHSIKPHMHVRGVQFKVEVKAPGNSLPWVILKSAYNPFWQTGYKLKEKLLLKKGSIVKVSATYNNSNTNPLNPAPKKSVAEGPQFYENEMHRFSFEYLVPNR